MSKKIKYFKSKVKSIDPATFKAEVVISDETVDRHGERVLVSSFKKTIKEFMKHPVLLSSHNYRGLTNQIGKFHKLKVVDNEVVGTVEYFVNAGNPEANWGWKLVEKGIAAYSIGFIPVAYQEFNEEEAKKHDGSRCDYTEIELLETSQVLVPANPSALLKSFESGIISKETEEEIKLLMEPLDTEFLKELEAIEAIILAKVEKETVPEAKEEEIDVEEIVEIHEAKEEDLEEDRSIFTILDEILKEITSLKAEINELRSKEIPEAKDEDSEEEVVEIQEAKGEGSEQDNLEETVSPEKLKEMSDEIRKSLGFQTEGNDEATISYIKGFIADINEEAKKIFSVPPSGKEQ